MTVIQEIFNAVETGRAKKAVRKVEEALELHTEPIDILDEAMIPALKKVGDKFESGEVFVPEMLIAARAMKKCMIILEPYFVAKQRISKGKYILATVSGDQHDIGKNLVRIMLESVGFEVVDLGVDVTIQEILDAIKQNKDVKIVGLSALLTTTMPAMRDAVRAIRELNLDKKVKIMVGGAPISQEFADKIGADFYTEDASEAARVACQIVDTEECLRKGNVS